MKRLILLLLAPAVLLAGCANNFPPEPSETPPLSEQAVLDAYAEAALVYDWFDLASLPTESESVEADGMLYHPVAYEGLTTYAALEARVRASFAPALAKSILDSSINYRDIGGRLCCAEGARGSNLFLMDKTVTAEQVDGSHWTVMLTFWADSWEWERPSATIGYSQTALNYEQTEEGWRFTSICPSDGLDLDAETVFQFSYEVNAFMTEEQHMERWSDLQLACWLLHADGAFSEAPIDLLSRRFLEDPEAWFSALSVFADSPWENAHFPMEGPAYDIYGWYGEAEQRRFQDILDSYQPKNSAEQSLLDGLNAARTQAMESAAASAAASFCLVTEGRHLSLGGKGGVFPWGLDLEARSLTYHEGMDGFYPFYEADCGSLRVWYSVSPEDGSESVFRISTAQAGVHTLGGIEAGDTEEDVLAVYTGAVPLGAVGEERAGADYALIYEPGGLSCCKHIAFFITDGIVTSIEIEDLMDGRLLSD